MPKCWWLPESNPNEVHGARFDFDAALNAESAVENLLPGGGAILELWVVM